MVYDFNGRYEIKGSSQSSTAGIGLAAEYYHYISDSFGAGCGLLVQNQRSAGDIAGSFSFIPAYLSLKIRSTPTVPYKYGYAVAQLGYNIFRALATNCRIRRAEYIMPQDSVLFIISLFLNFCGLSTEPKGNTAMPITI